MKWKGSRNLRLRPAKPALGRGRLQVQIRRAFVVHGSMVTSSQVYNWTHAKRRLMLGKPLTTRHRYSVWRILVAIADPVDRGTSIGRPWLWRLRNSESAQTSPVLPGEAKKSNS
jgi:hypothetical protein